MRVIIIGAGGVGSMAAWRMAATGCKVTVIERFRIDHDRGSSFGDSRIVRRVYHNPIYTRMMAAAYEMWDRLMAESGEHGLFVQSGGIFFGTEDNPDVTSAELALRESGVAYEKVDAAEAMRRFPAFRLDPHEAVLYEPSMGYARASSAVRAAANLARRSGAVIREECVVIGIEAGFDSFRVDLQSGERLSADHVVVCAGPWAGPLLQTLGVRLPLTVTRQPYIHLEPQRESENFEQDRFPVWIDASANAYGFPRLGDVPGVKIGIHDYGAPSTPDSVDRAINETDRQAARAYAARRFPALGTSTTYEKVCLYTVTPDNDFIIDSVPGVPRITIISACSGHGFKFTPLLGQFAADISVGRKIGVDLSPFQLARFMGND